MTEPVPCPSCGGAMVYLSSQHRYQCFRCLEADREPEKPVDWWFWLMVLGLFLFMIVMLFLARHYDLPLTENITAAVVTGDLENDDIDRDWSVDPFIPALVLVGGVLAFLLVLDLVDQQHRCPTCAKVLRRTPHSYYCMRCRKHWPIEDIETKVVE